MSNKAFQIVERKIYESSKLIREQSASGQRKKQLTIF